jgi:hypothetical protein
VKIVFDHEEHVFESLNFESVFPIRFLEHAVVPTRLHGGWQKKQNLPLYFFGLLSFAK